MRHTYGQNRSSTHAQYIFVLLTETLILRPRFGCFLTNIGVGLYILIIKPTRCTDFLEFYFGMKLYMFRTVPLSIIRSYSLYNHQWYRPYVIQVCRQRSSRIRMELSSILILLTSCLKPVWHIPLLCVRWETPDDGQRNCPKCVKFHSKIKFEKISASSWFYYKDLSRPTQAL
jgi:hypothetical protein